MKETSLLGEYWKDAEFTPLYQLYSRVDYVPQLKRGIRSRLVATNKVSDCFLMLNTPAELITSRNRDVSIFLTLTKEPNGITRTADHTALEWNRNALHRSPTCVTCG